MKFRYKYYGKNEKGERLIRPVIPIKLISGDQLVRYEVLVDSGADRSIFHSEVADALGIRMTAGESSSFMGATGGKARMYIHPIQIEVGGWRFDTKELCKNNSAVFSKACKTLSKRPIRAI